MNNLFVKVNDLWHLKVNNYFWLCLFVLLFACFALNFLFIKYFYTLSLNKQFEQVLFNRVLDSVEQCNLNKEVFGFYTSTNNKGEPVILPHCFKTNFDVGDFEKINEQKVVNLNEN